MLANVSYRIKIPAAITVVIVLTEVVLTAILVSRAFLDARRDLESSAMNLSSVLARSLREPMLRDDIWGAFEVIRTPVAVRDPSNALQDAIVVDAQARVFAASDPKQFPTMTKISSISTDVQDALAKLSTDHKFVFEFPANDPARDVISAGMIFSDDGALLGQVVLLFDSGRFYARVRSTLLQVGLLSVPGFVILIVLGWLWGKRMAEPLSQLASAMPRIGRDPAARVIDDLPKASGDEIGVLASSVRHMLIELDRKEGLEKEVIAAERLAAVGRVAAGVAHEINNPLGGMLNAVDTLQMHANLDALTTRTLGLLERGLNQIRATVGALLVEARLDSPAMFPADWDDLRTLVEPQLTRKRVPLEWNNSVTEPLPLPAHQIRQLTLNLLLNASAAAIEGGRVRFDAACRDDALELSIENTGVEIPADRLGHLFEPFARSFTKGERKSYGIGLWVCYQIVVNLGGNVTVFSKAGITRFNVLLPIKSGQMKSCLPQSEFA